MPDVKRKKAEATQVEMDTVLSSAFFAFYWLSNSRKSALGMAGSIEFMIELTEIVSYYNTFDPPMDLQHFVRIIRAADGEYMAIQAETHKRRQQQEEATSKRK